MQDSSLKFNLVLKPNKTANFASHNDKFFTLGALLVISSQVSKSCAISISRKM